MKRLKYFALAALVAFAACDEGDEVVVPEPDVGTISGTVTVDGNGLAGVTVTLSSGSTTTTAANGDYAFSDVEAGAYTVTISNTPSDAAFATTSQAAVINQAGQVVDVDFAGFFITTSAISASVSVPGVGPRLGATVQISGQSSASAVTGSNGTVTFSGLRAGDYTVTATLSSADAQLYDLDTPSVNVTLDVDELQAVAFTATPKTISSITGRMYIDEATKNDQFDAGNEENLTIADVDVVIEGVSVGVFDTIQTDANGEYELSGLPAASYRISLDTTPFDGAVALGTQNDVVITLAVADDETVDFGFDIVEQTIVAGAFLGADEDNGPSGVAPRVEEIPGVDIDLYVTAQAANNAPGAGFLNDGDTDADGTAAITFDRADDTDPFGGPSDNVVFAIVGGLPTAFAGLVQNGEAVIEVPFPATDSIVTSDDVFDYLNGAVTVGLKVQEIDGDTYAGINVFGKVDTTTTPAPIDVNTDADGFVYTTLAIDEYFFQTGRNWGLFTDPAIPNVPSGPGGTTFTETFDEAAGTTDGSWLSFEYDGTSLPTDTVFIGTANLAWDEVIVRGRAYREFNEVEGYQAGMDLVGASTSTAAPTLQRDDSGTWVDVGTATPIIPGGGFNFFAVPVGPTYRLFGDVNPGFDPEWAVLDDNFIDVMADGSDQLTDVCPLQEMGTTTFANCGTFAVKAQNNTLSGTVLYRDGSDVPDGTELMISVNADSTVQGRASSIGDTVVTTLGGAFTTNATVREGYYKVTPVNDVPAVFFAETTNGDAEDSDVRGASQVVVIPDEAGFQAVTPASFHAHRTDATIRGYVVNDRDEDGNVVDTNEGLAGAVVTLYANDGAVDDDIAADSVVATATVDADGLFLFEDLVTRRYNIEAVAPGSEIVLSDGVVAETQYSVVPDNSDIDINAAPTAALPYWDFETSMIMNTGEAGEQDSYFTFLFTDGTYSGTVINDEDDSAVGSMSIQITRCNAYGAPLPLIPTAGDCTDNAGTSAAGTFQNTLTANDGTYSFDNLREGVYQVTIQTASAGDSDGAFLPGSTTGNGTASETFVFFIDGTEDLEQIEFRVDN